MTARLGGHCPPAEIRVCQDNSCRRAGSNRVLFEIEELAKAFGQCKVRPAGCLDNCDHAPNAVVIRGRKEVLCSHIKDLRKSAAVVQQATGRAPNLFDPVLTKRLTGQRLNDARRGRQGKQAESEAVMAGPPVSSSSSTQARKSRSRAPDAHKQLAELASEVAKKAGGRRGTKRKADSEEIDTSQPRMDKHAKWRLEGFTKVSKHSAIFHFSSTDENRSTPNLGSGRRRHKTWHTKLLAKVGANCEGPSPWIERDYTPISSWKDWEQGKCDILIKIYKKGLATQWLHKKKPGCEILLSQPLKTLDVPSFVPDLGETTLKSPASVLLVLAGTGIVVASQVLQHADRVTSFEPTPVMRSSVSLIYSCRRDDVLLIKDLMEWSAAGKLQRCTLTHTKPEAGMVPPFPGVEDADLSALASLPNARVVPSRISQELLANELRLSRRPCRIVVSGPAPFNAAVKQILSQIGVHPETITVLRA
eukprot:TRINITY_DN36116_c0_g1_i1.p1 TRINITY_DN36116_c0_g1~~TRINITY_DN36116_c0_g1_i1.p1  ORF type:complete len:476 (-),score=49.29 TRINITY_DN36116_c0_g1_i1:4-1431(-)